jgi:hypothetical protein
MLLVLDGLGERYHMLPHQVIAQASTFDLYVMNTARSWARHQQELAQAGVTRPIPHKSQEELAAIWAATKGQNKSK